MIGMMKILTMIGKIRTNKNNLGVDKMSALLL